MYTLQLHIHIAASPQRVWRALCNPNEVARWDTTVTHALDAPADYPQPGQHVQWRCRNTTKLLHDHPQHVEPNRLLHSHLTFGRQHLDETYTLTPIDPEAPDAADPDPLTLRPSKGRPEPVEGPPRPGQAPESPTVNSSLSLEGDRRAAPAAGRGEGDSHQSPTAPETARPEALEGRPPPGQAPEAPTVNSSLSLEGEGWGEGDSRTTTRLDLQITLKVRAPFIAGPILLHLIDGPNTRRAFEASLTNLKHHCELAPD